nr:AP-3 complex subunit mu-like [Aegilops tauschii subsp. strangulata]
MGHKGVGEGSPQDPATQLCYLLTSTDLKEYFLCLASLLVDFICREGVLVKCEACGVIEVNSSLPGLPELTLSFANPTLINDVRFHPCVRFRPWESNQILSFVPPDGQFKLMSYRVKKLKTTPIYVKPQLSSDSGNCRVNVMVGIRNDPGKPINSITVQFQLPPPATALDFYIISTKQLRLEWTAREYKSKL